MTRDAPEGVRRDPARRPTGRLFFCPRRGLPLYNPRPMKSIRPLTHTCLAAVLLVNAASIALRVVLRARKKW